MRYLLRMIKQNLFILMLGGLFCLGLYSRFYQLGNLLPGLYVDETSIGYNADSLVNTGIDEHGRSWPVYFEAFGEWKNPIYIYSQAGLFRLFGVSTWSLRFTSALWGVVAVGLYMWFSWTISKSAPVVLITGLLMVFNPWHWLLSRVVFEVITFPALLFACFLLLYRYHQTNKSVYFYLFSFTVGVSFYSYTAARFIAPALMVSAMAMWFPQLKYKVIGNLSLFGLTLLPAYFWERTHPGSLLYAYHRVSNGFGDQIGWLIQTTFYNYLIHFSPNFLFGEGDGFLRHMIGYHSGFLWVGIPFLLYGLFFVVSQIRKNKFYRMLLVFLLLSPLPAAVTTQTPHGLRSIGLLPALLMISVIGVQAFYLHSRKHLTLFIFIVALMWEVLAIGVYIKTEYLTQAEVWFDQGVVDQMLVALNQPGPYYFPQSYQESIYVTWLFLKRHHPPGQLTPTGSDTTALSQIPQNLTSGTYVLNQTLCDEIKLRINPDQVVHENYQGCVVKVN